MDQIDAILPILHEWAGESFHRQSINLEASMMAYARLLSGRTKCMALTLLSLGLAVSLAACGAWIQSSGFTHITLEEWIGQSLFTPVILQPEPGKTKLLMGPMLAKGAGRVELYYTEEFVPNASPAAYNLYESSRPLFIGGDILPHWEATNKDIETEHISLVLLGSSHSVELRRNKKRPNEGLAIFEIEGTSVACHWRNVAQSVALRALAESITLVRADDLATISSFDQKLQERRKHALEANKGQGQKDN